MTQIDPDRLPRHVAVIMDGNGRWAKMRGMNRVGGHKKGAEAVRKIVEASREIGIQWLTLYAFSEENWNRPEAEVQALMMLLNRFVKSELKRLQEQGIRLHSIGRINKLPEKTRKILLGAIEKTASNKDMVLTLALSYGDEGPKQDEDLGKIKLPPVNEKKEKEGDCINTPPERPGEIGGRNPVEL